MIILYRQNMNFQTFIGCFIPDLKYRIKVEIITSVNFCKTCFMQINVATKSGHTELVML